MNETQTLPAPLLPSPRLDKWRQEQQAFHMLLPQLLTTHKNLFVAIHEGRVVESGDDKLAVASRSYAKFGYVPIYVGSVVETPSVVRMPTPRAVPQMP